MNIVDTPILFAICMALGIILASALVIWISIKKKEK